MPTLLEDISSAFSSVALVLVAEGEATLLWRYHTEKVPEADVTQSKR